MPLCGKSADLVWLAARGHAVIGVELSEIAVREFVAENALEPTQEQHGTHTVWRAGPIEIWQGDYFSIPKSAIGRIDGVYDRAALVAMPPAMQQAYAAKTAELVTAGTPMLLIAFDYDQSRMSGPPFSVPAERVRELYRADFDIAEIDRIDVLDIRSDLRQRGLTALTTIVMQLNRR